MKKLAALVIEEDVVVCENLCQLLELLDIHARPAFTLQAAHLCLDDDPPDIIFLSSTNESEDRMQLMNCLRGKQERAHAPVILVSDGSACPEIDGVVDVVSRPASLDAVEKCLRKTGLY
ncbi:MAG: hypothetical protein PHQ40_19765 [Anaerolineaceae bacterium]|nr:hypothetical protein [Anaerolineaceae bacterium]